MDPFSYHNLFETKGIEYLVIILFLALLVPFSIILNKKVKIGRKIREISGLIPVSIRKVPGGIYHSSNHTWAHLTKSGIAEVGVDNLIPHLTGESTIRLLKNPGDSIKKGEAFAVLEHGQKALSIFAPVSGSVITGNPSLFENPGLPSSDPYGAGWLLKVKPIAWKEETQPLLLAEGAAEWSKRELERFREFLAVKLPQYQPENAGIILQDGGELRDGVMADLPDGLWSDFQREFLDPH
jgi:glycine cleavage system H protein